MKARDSVIYGYETSSPDRYAILKANAKNNRRRMTNAEQTLWQELRHNRYKLKFRRQHPIDDYIADFVCLPYRLIIEVDGEYHGDDEQRESDAFRTRMLNKRGFKVIRFTNGEVETDVKRVAEAIYDEIFSHPQ